MPETKLNGTATLNLGVLRGNPSSLSTPQPLEGGLSPCPHRPCEKGMNISLEYSREDWAKAGSEIVKLGGDSSLGRICT